MGLLSLQRFLREITAHGKSSTQGNDVSLESRKDTALGSPSSGEFSSVADNCCNVSGETLHGVWFS